MPLDDPIHSDRDRAESFGTVAANYDRFRPELPGARSSTISSRSRPRAVARRRLRHRQGRRRCSPRAGWTSLGVEIDPKMAEVARAPRRLGRGVVVRGLGRRRATFDLITCAQAWHWVDPLARRAEGGAGAAPAVAALALFWNDDDTRRRRPRGAGRRLSRARAGTVAARRPDQRPRRTAAHARPFEASPDFADVETRTYAWSAASPPRSGSACACTHSDHLLLPPDRRPHWPTRREPLLDRRRRSDGALHAPTSCPRAPGGRDGAASPIR